MRIKKFRGKSVDGLLRLIKSEVGPDAELLETGSVREPGILGYFRPRQIQMTVAIEDHGEDLQKRPPVVREKGPAAKERAPDVKESSPGQDVPAALDALQEERSGRLVGRGVPRELAPILARKAAAKSAEDIAWMRTVPIRPPRERDGRRVVALVGPTGAGKTTTCAKLAARMALGEGLRVGLITQDTYRIGAVEQLRKYARILGMDLEVVFAPEEIDGAMKRLGDSQVVLIDTAGHNPRDLGSMERLGSFLAAAGTDEVHLVLSAGTAVEDAQSILARYRKAAYNRLLLTKIDETDRPGRVIAFAEEAGVPLSYVCTGQEVPNDIGPASEVLSGVLLEGVV